MLPADKTMMKPGMLVEDVVFYVYIIRMHSFELNNFEVSCFIDCFFVPT